MLASKQLKAFLPTVLPQQAKTFYKDVLGLTLLSEDNFALEFNANGTRLRVIIVPQLTPQQFTALGWEVDDISTAVNELKNKGISCEKYDFIQQDEANIWTAPDGTKVAWFKDPDGNILSLSQH